jgi:2-polyprenyl-6-methoxyphenol hydroxylase-like FAD-dependent oxidoreductase
MALLDAQALALALEQAGGVAEALELYARLRRRHVRLFQALSLLFTPFYQSDSRLLPVLRDRLVAPTSRWLGVRRLVAAAVAGTLVDPLRRA